MIEIYPTQVCFLSDEPFATRQRDDCSIIMVAAIADVSYQVAARVLRSQGKVDDDGCTDLTWRASLICLGCDVKRIRTIRRTVRTVIRSLPDTGRYVIVTTDHVVAYVNGELVDDEKWGDLLRVSAVYKVDHV